MSNFEKAQAGLGMIKEAILAELRAQKQGMTNAEIVHKLGLESEVKGQNRNYLSWSILGMLVTDGRLNSTGEGKNKRYYWTQNGQLGD